MLSVDEGPEGGGFPTPEVGRSPRLLKIFFILRRDMAKEGFLVSEEEEPSEMFKTRVRSKSAEEEALEGVISRDDL